MDTPFLFMLTVFIAVAMVVYLVSRAFVSDTEGVKLRSRLSSGIGNQAAAPEKAETPIWQKIGQAAASPFMPKSREKQSDLRKQLGHAGIYSPAAIKMVAGSKVIFLAAGLFGGYAVGMLTKTLVLPMSIGGLVGYILPVVWLKLQIKNHQKLLDYGLADALDLMVVCVEAGLTIDSAIERVGREMALAHPRISRELSIAHMETRVGLSRAEALKNLGQRTGSSSLQSLSAMLIQADRFGTSIASALRIHAESLRTKRQHAAEEMAGKASVKMSFPLILFIFPALFIVLAGPTVIRLMQSNFLD